MYENDACGESWFRDSVERKVGDDISAADMCRSGWGLDGNGWVWCRRLFIGFLGVVSRSGCKLFCWRGISSVEPFGSERLVN
ncbi:hypothetical protein TSUD_351630 [Trifolium subterraneum]|uniref:Uncharacterized protein n=1 Tax=Trifolium subterraneum TaxID=3900 RepID=A0A2Z6NKC2_TRISU|nr:hypothetical protein TSUD_351630 [Trifolium subterraneum]